MAHPILAPSAAYSSNRMAKAAKADCISLAFLLSVLSTAIVVGHALMLIVLWKDPLKRFRTPATIFVFGMVSANFLSGAAAGPLIVYQILAGCRSLKNRQYANSALSNTGSLLLYWSTSVSYLSMLGLSLCQYIGVKIPHKHAVLVTKKTTSISIAIMTIVSLVIPILLPLGASPETVEKLQLHIAFQLITFCLCAVYVALGREYLLQVKRARACAVNMQGAACIRVRDRNFTRANLTLLACVTVLSIPIMISWYFAAYGVHSSPSNFSQWTYRTITIAIFLLKIALDPYIYCLRLTIYRRAFKSIFKLNRVRRIGPRECNVLEKTGP